MAEVSVDKTHHSLSFNEYLTLISVNRRAQPTENALLDAFMWELSQILGLLRISIFRNFDPENTGKISEELFKQILKTKDVPQRDINEMIAGWQIKQINK